MRAIWPSFLWASIVLKLTLSSPNKLPRFKFPPEMHLDKWVHFTLFGVQTWLLLVGLSQLGKIQNTWSVLWISASVCAFSISIEYLQPYVGRTHDWLDVAANTTGCAIAAIYFLYRQKK